VFQSSAHLLLVVFFAAFLAVAFAVATAGAREQARQRRGRRPGDPIRVDAQLSSRDRHAYLEWLARHDRRRRF
jgi:hypothetical protein